MDDACPQGRSGGAALPAITRRAPAVVLRTTGSPARPAAPGRRNLWLPGRCVDTQPDTLPREQYHRIDGRSLRRTGRTVQFATRVSEEWDDKLRRIAQRDGLKLVEVLERALEAYEEGRKEMAAR